MKTHFFKRGIAGLLSLVMCLSAFIREAEMQISTTAVLGDTPIFTI